MRDDVSPNSSREPTPCFDDGYTGSSGLRFRESPNAITNLSEQFHRHSITSRQPYLLHDDSTSRAQEHLSNLQLANDASNLVCRRSRSTNRLQCSSNHLARISALVEDMVCTGIPPYHQTHPRSMLDDSISPSLSPDEQSPCATSYFGFTSFPSSYSTATNQPHSSAQHQSRHSQSYKIDKELRHCASRAGLNSTARMVKKEIRVRKSTKNMSDGVGRIRG